MEGWVKVHRSIKNHWLWDDKPFDKRSAWIDLILSANHQTRKIVLGNEIIEVERGSFITSEIKLMERWGWSKTKVRSFLDLLQNDKMLVKKSDKKKTTLTICNYSIWQESETTKEPQKDHKKTTKEPQKDTNKNDKNDKNEKNKNKNNNTEIKNNDENLKKPKPKKHRYGEYKNVLLTDAEVEKLKVDYGKNYDKILQMLDEGIELHGYKYQSHSLAIRKWAKKSDIETVQETKKKQEKNNIGWRMI